jgi:hypothetical protein
MPFETHLIVPIEINYIDALTCRSFMKRVQHIGFLPLPSQQAQAKNSNVAESLFQLIEVQISAYISIATLTVTNDYARITPHSTKQHPPLQTWLLDERVEKLRTKTVNPYLNWRAASAPHDCKIFEFF